MDACGGLFEGDVVGVGDSDVGERAYGRVRGGRHCATQAAFWGGAWVLRRFREPAEAAAIAFAISYAANFAVCYAYARGRHGFRLKGATGAMWLGGLALVSAVSLGVAGV